MNLKRTVAISGTEVIREFVLINDSQVPIDFRINRKNTEKSCQQGLELGSSNFEVEPQSGTVKAFSESTVKVIINLQI